jgi:hypothetical protein
LFCELRLEGFLRSSRLLNSKRSGQVTVGVDLGEQVLRLLLDAGDGVGTGDPADWRLLGAGELDQRRGELGGIAALQAVHAGPGRDGRPIAP